MAEIIHQIKRYFGPLLVWSIIVFGMLFFFYKSKIFLSAWIAGFVAQFLKMVVSSIKLRRFYPSAFFRISGMPSAHSATGTALTAAIYFNEGFTPIFIVSFFTLFIIFYDLVLTNEIITSHEEKLFETLKMLKNEKRIFKEEWGHDVSEVIFGAIVGILVSIVVHFI